MKDIEFSIIIPAFNEEENIENFLRSLQKVISDINDASEIIVIDDGSADKTFSIASIIPGIKVYKHPYNKGNGASVKLGISEASGEKLVIIDADGQQDPVHIPEMIALLDEYDLVVGARKSFGAGKRGVGNVIVSKLASYLSGIFIPDLTSGYRAFKKEKMLEFIDLLPNGYSLPSTSTLAFATSGYNVKFIPIVPHERQGGKSNINVSMDGVKFLVLIFRMISLFKPLKIFVPVSVCMFMFGLLWSVKTLAYSGGLSPAVVMLFLAGVLTLLFGFLADQIAETRLSMGRIKKILLEQTLGKR